MVNIRKGFTFVEIMIALAVVGSLALAVISFSTSSAKTANRTVAYLQALQLAYETIEWLKTFPTDVLADNDAGQKICSAMSDSITDTGTLKSSKLQTGSVNGNENGELTYPESYAKSWFHRKVKLEKINDGDKGRFLIKATVIVGWTEGSVSVHGDSVISEKNKLKEISLTTTLLDEFEYY